MCLSIRGSIALHFSHFGAAMLLPLQLLRGLIDGDESLSWCLFLAPPMWINKTRHRSDESAAKENKTLSDESHCPPGTISRSKAQRVHADAALPSGLSRSWWAVGYTIP